MTRQHLSYILLLIIYPYLLLHTPTVQAAETDGPDTTIPEKITDFQTCAVTGVKRIPQLQRSKIEIDIRHLDEDDSRWSYVPTLSLSSYYYFSEDEATISFNAANYRPWEPYYTLQARKLITHIVMLKHVQATAQALYKLADTFLQLFVTDQNESHYKQIVDLSQKRLHYAKQRYESGLTTDLEIEFEEQRNAFIAAEYEGNAIKRDALLNGLCISMNLPDPTVFDLDAPQVLKQILGNSPLSTPQSSPQPKDSIEQQIMQIKGILQQKNITLAYSKFLPDFSIGFRSPDVLNVSVNDDQEYFLYAGMSLTLWDGNKRSRDITRQKMVLRQMDFEKKEIENNDSLEWLKATQQYSSAKSAYALSQSIEKLNNIQMKKREIDYARGTIELPELIDHQIALHRKSLDTIQKQFSLNKATLKLRHLSGQLLKDTFNISLADIPYE
ncbi:outer membrane protein [Desulfocapsa sulfexigens DSM 10523]|uniref:Outer membrane protein n=1 Tax=Desulfocapsa sulfexigens (strain DSM 10523 / SB164P1) TaxID=1167006 RepID=M1PQ80_DESSD|nr:TolC family protein [Desulfocapsa sulfexigens]AGF78536.1 outer membrane protein [Desulfocapsa sulfexigens DSM 10523]